MKLSMNASAKWLSVTVLSAVLSVFTLASISTAQELVVEQAGHFGGYPGGAAIKGNHAFLIQATTLTVLDVSGAEFQKVGSLTLPEEPNQIIVRGNYAYAIVTMTFLLQLPGFSACKSL